MRLLLSLISVALLTPNVSFANASWKVLVNTDAEIGRICFEHGQFSHECMALTGVPIVLGGVACVAKNEGDTAYSYLLRWSQAQNDQIQVSVSDIPNKLTLPRPPGGSALSKLVWVRGRIVGSLKNSDVENPSAKFFRMPIENDIKDLPGIVEGLPTEAVLEIETNDANKPVKAKIAGLEFECIQTTTPEAAD